MSCTSKYLGRLRWETLIPLLPDRKAEIWHSVKVCGEAGSGVTYAIYIGERQSWRAGADCKSVAFGLSGFDSHLPYHKCLLLPDMQLKQGRVQMAEWPNG